MVHQAGLGTNMVWNSSADGTNWIYDQTITDGAGGPPQGTDAPPVIAFDGHYIHLIHPNYGTTIWWSYFDGNSWSPEVTLPGTPGTWGQPALVGDYQHLLMVHKAGSSGDGRMFWSEYSY
jgi:hypothetical protein